MLFTTFKNIYDSLVSALSIVINGVVLASVWSADFEPRGYKRFLISLSFSGLYIAVVNVATLVYQITLTRMYNAGEIQYCNVQYIIRNLQITGFLANLQSLVAMSTDHFIGIIYPLHYNKYLNARTCRFAIFLIWFFSFALGFTDVFVGFVEQGWRMPKFCSSDDVPPIDNVYGRYVTEAYSPAVTTPFTNEAASLNYYKESDTSFLTSGNGSGVGDLLTAEEDTATYSGNKTAVRRSILEDSDVADSIVDAFIQSIMDGKMHEAENVTSGSPVLPSEVKARLQKVLQIFKPKQDELQQHMASSCCEQRTEKSYALEFAVMGMTGVCFAFLIFCYGRIFKEVFRNKMSARSLRKLVVTTCLLLGAFILCWLPFMSFEFFMYLSLINKPKDEEPSPSPNNFLIIHGIFHSLLVSAPLLDPLIYSARLRCVQRQILIRLACLCPFWEKVISFASATRSSIQTAISLTSLKRLVKDDSCTLQPFDVPIEEGYIDGDITADYELKLSKGSNVSPEHHPSIPFNVDTVAVRFRDSDLPPAIYRKCSRFFQMIDEAQSESSPSSTSMRRARLYSARNGRNENKSFRKVSKI